MSRYTIQEKLIEDYWVKKIQGKQALTLLTGNFISSSKLILEVDSLVYFNKLTGNQYTAEYTVILSIYSVLIKKYFPDFDGFILSENIFQEGISNQNSLLFLIAPIQHLSLKSHLQEVKKEMQEVISYSQYSIESLKYRIGNINFKDFTTFSFNYPAWNKSSRTPFQLNVIKNAKNNIEIQIIYTENFLQEHIVERFLENIEKILINLEDYINLPINQIPILSDEELNLILNHFNNTNKDYPQNKIIIDLFEEQVYKTPNNTAVIFEDKEITYKELNEWANQLGCYLRKKYNIQPDDLIGIKLERSEQLIMAVLGILKSSAAYVPIDTNYPQERIEYIVKDANLKLVIDEKQLETFRSKLAEYSKVNLPLITKPNHLAYCIYTSGSTGKPKGVLNSHAGLYNRLLWMKDYLSIDSKDIFLQKTPYTFDVSVWELILPLITGGSLVIAQPEGHKDSIYLQELISKRKITISHFVPSMLSVFLVDSDPDKCRSLSHVICSGEALSVNIVEQFKTKLKHVCIHNFYGPTEAAIDVTAINLTNSSVTEQGISIGYPVPNTRIYIVDEANNLQPISIPGELLISGVQVAKGYLNLPELTQKQFVQDPFTKGSRVYRTGDIAKWLPDGSIQFLGRKDHQLKIHGYRIELGEIELNISQYSEAIKQVIVDAKETNNEKLLIAYYVSDVEIDKTELRNYLKQKLPEYMVPSFYIALDSIPLNTNGKIDRKALPNIKDEDITQKECVAPRNETERKLVDIWQDVLGVKKIGITDNFFALGGHSLKVARLASEIHKTFEARIVFKELFAQPLLEEQAKLISKAKKIAYPTIPLVPIQEHYELSPSQRRLWLIHQIGIDKASYNISGTYDFEQQINLELFKKAIIKLAHRHEVLRTVFIEIDGSPRQKIIDLKEINLDIDVVVSSTEKETKFKLNDIQQKIFNYEFKLDVWPLFKFAFIKEKGHCRLLFSIHHIISDGWSMELFLRDLLAIYQSELTGNSALLPSLSIQYKDYANWQNILLLEEDMQRQEEYWVSKLEGLLPDMRLPFDYESSTEIWNNKAQHFYLYIDEKLKKDIDKFLIHKGVSLFSFLTACFKILLHRLTGETDIILGTPVANREHDEIKNLIGFFLNTIMLRDRLEIDTSFETFLKQVNHTLLNALENQTYPFEELLEKLNIQRDYYRFPISSVFLNMLNFNSTEKKFLNDFTPKHKEGVSPAKFDLECYIEEYENGISLNCTYKINLFKPETIEYWMNEFISVIKQSVNDSCIKIKNIKIFENLPFKIDVPESQNSFTYFNDEAINQSIVSRFEEQVKKYPSNIAISQNNKNTNYEELNALANGLAEKIIAIGKSKEANIVLLLEHGRNAIIGIFGVLKSGNAYVPLDTDYPFDRLKYIIEDTNCKLIIASSETINLAKNLLKELPEISIINISGDILPRQLNLAIEIDPESKAYILYTSGSTGKPKGVIQSHKNILHFIRVYTNNLHIGVHDKLSLLPTYTFDASVSDIYSALLNGSSLYPYNLKQNGIEYLKAWLEVNRISIVHIVPTIYRYFISELNGDSLKDIRLVVLGGEPIYKYDFENFKKYFNKGAILVNTYGPTESSTVLQNFLDHDTLLTARNIPLGFPVQDTELYLLNEKDEEVGVYQIGEIVYKSNYLSLGYLNNTKQTEVVFTTDPIAKNGRVYRSGDWGRMLPTGQIEFIGRSDGQIKLNGQRIELSEIEQSLLKIEGVEEAIVLLKILKGQDKLVAYLRTSTNKDEINIIKQELSKTLPAYMVPAVYIFIEKFPLTRTGKINRLELPEPTEKDLKHTDYVAPRNHVEEKLVEIWKEVFGIDRVGIKDNFFELGGHSLKAIQLISRIKKEYGVNINLITIFNNPTIEGIYDEIRKTNLVNNTLFENSISNIEKITI